MGVPDYVPLLRSSDFIGDLCYKRTAPAELAWRRYQMLINHGMA